MEVLSRSQSLCCLPSQQKNKTAALKRTKSSPSEIRIIKGIDSTMTKSRSINTQIPYLDLAMIATQQSELASLHKPLTKPKPGEWRWSVHEKKQTYEDYQTSDYIRPSSKRNTLYFGVIGSISEKQRLLLKLTSQYMSLYFCMKVKKIELAGISEIPDAAIRFNFSLPSSRISELPPPVLSILNRQLPPFVHFTLPALFVREQGLMQDPALNNPELCSKQLHARYLLVKLMESLPADALSLIAFTANDLWPGDDWNFVFGLASAKHRVGVWSVHRFGNPEVNQQVFQLALKRTLKLAMHETCHMFSMEHCAFYACNMCGTISINETDRLPLWLCHICLAKLILATGDNPIARYIRLKQFCIQNGLKEEAEFFERSITVLKKTFMQSLEIPYSNPY